MTYRLVRLALLPLMLTACDTSPPASGATAARTEAPVDNAAGRVTLTEAAAATAGIQTEAVVMDRTGTDALVVPGQVVADPRHVALITPRVAGRLERLTAGVGDTVRAGQTVAFVFSPAFLTAQSDYRQSARRAQALAGTPDSAGAAALLLASERRLRIQGASDSALRRLADGNEPELQLALTAPFDGSIVEALALAGAAVQPGTPVFRLIDLTELDIAANIPEAGLARLAVGQRARVTFAAFPGLVVTGRVERIKDELEQVTRTVEAMIHVRNPGRRLRPGMFATVELVMPHPAAANLPVVPESALLSDGDARIVFVMVAPLTFERRVVEPASHTTGGQRIRIAGGLRAGERVAVRGVFILKSELTKRALAEEER